MPAVFGAPSTEGSGQEISQFSFGHGAIQPIVVSLDGLAIFVAGGVATLVYERLVASGEKVLDVDFLSVTAVLFVYRRI